MIASYCTQEVTVFPFVSSDYNGVATYGAGVLELVRFESRYFATTGVNGKEILIEGACFFLPSAVVPVRSKVVYLTETFEVASLKKEINLRGTAFQLCFLKRLS